MINALLSVAVILLQVPGEPSTAAFNVAPGTKIPLSLLNSISTKNAAEGDRIYLETLFPVVADGKVIIPIGSSVAGTVTTVKRAGRVKGRAELFVRFDSLILPNGVMRDFRARMTNVDGTIGGTIDREEGRIEADGNKGGDAKVIGDAAVTGAMLGGLAGIAAGSAGMGMGIGAGAAATAAMIGILVTRGPDAVLTKGTTVEMLLDRPLQFSGEEIDFSKALISGRRALYEASPAQRQEPGRSPVPGKNLSTP